MSAKSKFSAQAAATASGSARKTNTKPSGSVRSKFDERDYDFDAIEKKLLSQ